MHRVIVFRHGILINRWLMKPMERFFLRRGYDVRNRSYPTTRKYIEEHAQDLARELRQIARELQERGESFEIHCVVHSMGALVLRYALSHLEAPPVRRAVLLVPPNQGSASARFVRDFFLYRWLFGRKAGSQLAADPPGIYGAAGVPTSTEIGIIAGSARWKLYPFPLEKPNDGVVSVAEARLPPFPLKVLPHGHTPILFARGAWEETAHLLEHGSFRDGE